MRGSTVLNNSNTRTLNILLDCNTIGLTISNVATVKNIGSHCVKSIGEAKKPLK